MNRILFHILTLTLILTGCRKDKDEVFPEIDVQLPLTASGYQVPTNIPVRAVISDNREVEQVVISLLDSDLLPTGNSMILAPGSREVTIDTALYINSPKLGTGVYFVRIEASDGTNLRSSHTEIQLTGIPRQVEGIYAILQQGAGSVLAIAEPQGSTDLMSLNGTHTFAFCNSWDQQFIRGSGQLMSIEGIQADGYASIWQETSFSNSGNENIGDAYYEPEEQRTWTVEGGTTVASYGANGRINAINVALNNHEIVQVAVNEELVITLQEPIGGGPVSLCTHFRNSGAFRHSVQPSWPAYDLGLLDDDEFLVLGSDQSSGGFYLYQAESNILTPVGTMNPAYPVKLIKSGNGYLVLTDQGIGAWGGGYTQLVQGTFADVAYDELSQSFYAAAGSSIFHYDLQGNLLDTRTASSTVEAVMVRYNR